MRRISSSKPESKPCWLSSTIELCTCCAVEMSLGSHLTREAAIINSSCSFSVVVFNSKPSTRIGSSISKGSCCSVCGAESSSVAAGTPAAGRFHESGNQAMGSFRVAIRIGMSLSVALMVTQKNELNPISRAASGIMHCRLTLVARPRIVKKLMRCRSTSFANIPSVIVEAALAVGFVNR